MKKITRRMAAGLAGSVTALTASDYTRVYKRPEEFRTESGFPLEAAIWHCPALCGCSLAITAHWGAEAIKNGHSFQHPRPGSIVSLEVNTVCESHRPMLHADIEDDPYGGRPGYITLTPAKLANASQAEKLYIYLYRYHGQVNTALCGCRTYVTSLRRWADHTEPREIFHPLHTSLCPEHRST